MKPIGFIILCIGLYGGQPMVWTKPHFIQHIGRQAVTMFATRREAQAALRSHTRWFRRQKGDQKSFLWACAHGKLAAIPVWGPK